MTSREFFEKVSEMRRTQQDYFKTRNRYFLIRSRELEQEIDEEIKRVTEILTNQPK